MNRKIDLQGDVFNGISSVFAVKGGIETTSGKATLTAEKMLEFPVSDESGFSFDTGSPSINHFKIKGLNTDWTCTFTPGDGQITLEIPCHETNILETVYGQEGVDVDIQLPAEVNLGAIKGKAFASTQKAIMLGLLVLNDTEDKILYIKKAKFMAQTMFDSTQKPLCVTLTGTIAAGADKDAFGILVPTTLSLDKYKATVKVGENVTISSTPSGATWESNSVVVATVSEGTVHGVAKGVATITATKDGGSASCEVTVIE